MTVVVFHPKNAAETMAHLKTLAVVGDVAPVEMHIGGMGKTSDSLIMCQDDWKAYVDQSDIPMNTTQTYMISSCNKMYAHHRKTSGEVTGEGSAHQITADQIELGELALHRPDLKLYWAFRKGNPDKVQ